MEDLDFADDLSLSTLAHPTTAAAISSTVADTSARYGLNIRGAGGKILKFNAVRDIPFTLGG